MFNRYPLQRQFDSTDCGASSLAMVMMQFGVYRDITEIRERVGQTRDGISLLDIEKAAETYHINSLPVSITFDDLKSKAPLPLIAHWKGKHFIVVNKITRRHIHLSDPAIGNLKMKHKAFMKGWMNGEANGIAILFEPTIDFFSLDNSMSKKKNLGILWTYVHPYQKFIWHLLTGLLLVSLINVAMPFLTQRIVDYGILAKDLSFIYVVLIAQLFLFSCTVLISSIRNWITLHIVSRVNYRMVTDYLYKLFQMPISYFTSKQSGDLLQRIFDHGTIDSFLGNNTTNSLFGIFNLIVFSSILAYFDLSIFIIYLAGTVLYFLWILLFIKKRKKIDNEVFNNETKNTDILLELFDNVEDIIINGSEVRRRRKWQKFQRQIFDVDIKRLSLEEYLHNGSNFINESKNILIMVIGAIAVISNDLSLGTLLAIQYILAQTHIPQKEIFDFFLKYQEAELAYDRLSEVHSQPPKVYNKNVEFLKNTPTIQLKNVSFSYGNSSRFNLNNLDIIFPPNQITALVGASGSGKTTLLKILLKYFPPVSGQLLINSISLETIDADYWRKNIAVVMQEGKIFNDTILNNITESLSEQPLDNDKLFQSIKLSNIDIMINSLPMGINTNVGKNGIQLSGGEKQRLLIARAIYKNTPVMIFDEATSALDSENEKEIINNLKDYFNKRTVIIIAHRLSTIKKADNIIVLGSGSVVEQGTHNQLLRQKGYYFNLINNQL